MTRRQLPSSKGKSTFRFPKAYRLLRSSEFKLPSAKKIRFDGFQFVYTLKGAGRLGISISKKAVRRANGRNRVRRLLKEAFRLTRSRMDHVDVHVVATLRLGEIWRELTLGDILVHFEKLASLGANKE